MADFGAPVAAGIDPGKGLSTLSDLMGLKQKGIAIQQAQQDHPAASFAGSLAGGASVFKLAPGEAIQGAQALYKAVSDHWDKRSKA